MSWASDIWIADVSGDNLMRVTTHPDDESAPRFSPDGSKLAFVSSRTGSRQIYVVELARSDEQVIVGVGAPQQITYHSEGFELHGWFPDGDHVLATGSRDHGRKYARRMIRVPVHERAGEEILVDAIADRPAVAADGNRILFIREGERWWRKGYVGERAAQIWLYEIDTGKFTELLHEGVDCRHPVWDGDRDAFFFTKGDYNGASLCRFDLESGEYDEIANFEDDSIVFPAINADGSHLIFRHLFDLYHLPLGSKRPIKKAKPSKIELAYTGDAIAIDDEMRRELRSANDITFSRDGLEMVFSTGGDLSAMDTKLKEPIQLSDTPGFESSPVLTDDALVTISVQDGQTDIYVSRDEPSSPRPAFSDITAHLGARFDSSFKGPGLLVADVLPSTPADRMDSKLMPGDVIKRIDGTTVDSKMDLTTVLNRPLDRDIVLSVKRSEQDEESIIAIRPTTFGTARARLYDKWLADNREIVSKRSKKKLGYLHIRSMDLRSFYEFEKQLYRVGYGREGLVIDVRDNGGGFTTDRLLTALTQPQHAITVPRDGGAGYPQDRMVFAVWQKPIIVLCNQNSFSNAEIFSHAIRNLGRGKLVGVQTAGGVISTGSVRIMDVGTMRMPFRGWFTANDGEDMELKGAMPHNVLWPRPGEIPAGKDRQLNKAVKILMKEVKKDAKETSMPKPKYHTSRDSS